MSLVLNVEILGEFKKLTAATQGANKQLQGMGDRSKKISQGIRRSFATIGVGLSFAAIAQGFKSTTLAAQKDIKSRDLLTLAIKNNSDATEEQIEQVHAYTDALELSAAVNEEELRPAFANLVRATNDVTKAQKLMEVALDVSAGTGKSLDVVTQAMGRALNGSTTALNRLVPALKNSKNPMADLAEAFKGANAEAAKQKSWERLQLILDRLTDDIGHLLLPVLEDFANWFTETYPKIQEFFNNLKKSLDDPAVKKSFQGLEDSVGELGFAIGTLFGSTETNKAKGFANFFVLLNETLSTTARLIAGLTAPLSAAFGNTKPMENWLDSLLAGILNVTRAAFGGAPKAITPGRISTPYSSGSGVNINITNRTPTGIEIIQKIREAERQTGKKYIR